MNMKPVNTLLAIALCATGMTAYAAITKEEHKAATQSAEMSYKNAKAACASLAGNAKDVCVAEAKVQMAYAVAKTDGEFKNTPKAIYDGRKDVATAEYDLAKTKCDALAGNAKDVCIKEAKAVEVRAQADAKAGTKISEARADASDAKSTANYKVAIEKCDTFSGDTKESCVKDAKLRFNK
ncbi:MAG: hypothetical protein IPP88_09130 [Betaproteobacteria bacterium]|nr:hypothetical protein [Betaproteobacteria bacterium]